MLDNANDIRNQTEKVNTNEASWGGFGGRFSYEESQSISLGGRICRSLPKIILGTAACAFLGMLGVLCAVMMYSIVNDNHSVYADAELLEAKGIGDAVSMSSGTDISIQTATAISHELTAEYVTPEQSKLYRVPMGVILYDIDEESAVYSSGFRSGDIIVALEGNAVGSVDVLGDMLAENKGDTVEITVFRDNVYMKMYITAE